MKNTWYKTKLAKAVLVIVAILCSVTTVTGILWFVSYPVLREELLDGKKRADKYEDTLSFDNKIQQYNYQVASGLSQNSIFETDGKYNPDKIIDIEEYYEKSEVSGENKSGLAYTLGDLLAWYTEAGETNGLEEDIYEISDDDRVIVCEKVDGTYQYYSYSEFQARAKAGELKFLVDGEKETAQGADMQQLLDNLKENTLGESVSGLKLLNKNNEVQYVDCWQYNDIQIKENYAPIGVSNLLQLVNENPRWNGHLQNIYEMLYSVIETLGSGYDAYTSMNSGIEEGDSNYYYIYADLKSKKVYTNKKEYSDFAKIEENISKMKKLGKYVVVRPQLSKFESNLTNENALTWRDDIKYLGPMQEDFVFVSAVDTDYPVHDDFYTEKQLFDKYASNGSLVVLGGVAAAFLLLICNVWLTAVAGRSSNDEELHLNWFDAWKTELAAAVVIILWIVPVLLLFGGSVLSFSSLNNELTTMYGYYNYVMNSLPYVVVGGIMAAYTCLMFLTGYLSLVRRLKAGTMWKNSALRAVVVFVKTVFENMNSVWKVIVFFGGFLVVHGVAQITGHSVLFVVLLPLDIAVFAYFLYQAIGKKKIKQGISQIAQGEIDYKIDTDGLHGEQKEVAELVNIIGEGLNTAVEKSVKNERLKTDLITNVSHDIKTPLTSIINYVELLKQENFEDPKLQRYIEVLEQKSQRLKTLTEDVVEASKVSSGNISLEMMNLNLVEMIQQTSGEFQEKFAARNLEEVLNLPEEEAMICVDGRRTWRVLENIYNNAAKYAMEGSRIYADLEISEDQVIFTLKNVSAYPLNISADELTERFIRGDISRSTEGSGLGLSIAKTLTEMQKGQFELYLDGDLFKVTIKFPRVK